MKQLLSLICMVVVMIGIFGGMDPYVYKCGVLHCNQQRMSHGQYCSLHAYLGDPSLDQSNSEATKVPAYPDRLSRKTIASRAYSSGKSSTVSRSSGSTSGRIGSYASYGSYTKREMPDCDDYEDFYDFMDDWDGNMPDGSDALDYWEDW